MSDDVLPFADAAAWEAWLHDHHASSPGVWVKIAKKGTGIASVRYPDVLHIALSYGWIDARPDARAFFAGLSSQNRYAILYRLQDAKRSETRARRLAKFVAMLEAGESIYP